MLLTSLDHTTCLSEINCRHRFRRMDRILRTANDDICTALLRPIRAIDRIIIVIAAAAAAAAA